MKSISGWERYEGGSPEAERSIFAELGHDILDVQLANKEKAGASEIQRPVHAKSVLAVDNAKLKVVKNLPEQLRVVYFRPGAEYLTTVRLSNANGGRRADYLRDMRGAALRIRVSADQYHDLL